MVLVVAVVIILTCHVADKSSALSAFHNLPLHVPAEKEGGENRELIR